MVALSAPALLAAATACSGAFSKRELVVYFNQNATQAQHRSALTACSGVAPHTSPEPMLKSRFVSDQVGDVRFRIDKADDRDITILLRCLTKQPGVVGYDIPE